MKALIVVNAYIKNKSQISQAERIAEELEKRGVTVNIAKNFTLASIKDEKTVAAKYDFCVYLDKDRVAARLLEGAGLRLFNKSKPIEVCDDKMLTNIALTRAGVVVPDCIYAPLCYYAGEQPDKNFLNKVAEELGFPLVAKTNYGSLGAGVALIETSTRLENYEKENMLTPHFYQKLIGHGGEDIRVIVIGGKFVCAMKRHNPKDFRSNIELGGTGENFNAGVEFKNLCEKVASILELDYCGVDVLTDANGKRYICEVNSNAFFATAEMVCGVNIAGKYAEYMLKNI